MKSIFSIISLMLSFVWGNCHAFDNKEWVKQDKISRGKYAAISKEIAKKFDLTVLCDCGVSTLIDDPNEIIWCSKFMQQEHALTLEEFRPVMQKIVNFLWQRVQSEPSFNKYLFYESQFFKKEIKLSPALIGMRIDFWGPNNTRYRHPYLSQVVFKEGKIHYFYADPVTQALVKPGIVEDLPEWVLGKIEEK